MKKMIPKIIHQTWKSFDDLENHYPLRNKQLEYEVNFLDCYKSWDEYNPDYDHIFYDDDEVKKFFKYEFPEYEELVETLPLIEMLDLFRYLLIYKYGGVWADIDCFCYRSFDELLDKDTTFVTGLSTDFLYTRKFFPPRLTYNQWCFAAIPKHPLLKAIIDRILFNCYYKQNYPTLEKTGEVQFTDIILKSKDKYEGIKLGPVDWFGTQDFVKYGKNGYPTYSLHLFAGSWKGQEWKDYENSLKILD